MRKIFLALLSLAAMISTATAEDHPRLHAKHVHAARRDGRYEAHGGYVWGHGGIGYFDADSGDDPCEPDIVQVSNRPVANIAANVVLQVAAAEICGGDQLGGGTPASLQPARCVHRMGVPDTTPEMDHQFMSFSDWQNEHPESVTPVVALESPSVANTRGGEIGESSEMEPPGYWDVHVIEDEDDAQNDQAQLVWCQTAEK